MRKKNVAILIQHLDPGGIEYLALDFLQKFPFSNIELVVLEGEKELVIKNWPQLSAAKNKIHFLNKQDGWDFKLVRKLHHLIQQQNYQLIHSHHIGPMIYGGLAAKISKIGHIHTEHDAWHLQNPKRRYLQRLALRLFQPTVIADAQEVANNYSRFTGSTTTKVILNGIDTCKFNETNKYVARESLGLPQKGFIFGTAGRLVPVKNHALLLEAFRYIKNPNSYLAIAGGGPLESTLRNQAKDLEIQDRVIFLGHIQDMPGFYGALDRFVLTSTNEGFPLCLIEAQATGAAVIASDVGGVREALCPSTAQLFSSGNCFQLQFLMKRSIEQNTLCRSPRSFVLNKACQQKMFSEYQTVYEEMLACR